MSHPQPTVISGVCYFASDFHLGAPNPIESNIREILIIKWLDQIKKDANHLFLLGDIFDFWFEYNGKPPTIFAKFLEKIAELRKKGIEIYFFTGNHDMWVKKYLTNNLGIHIYRKKQLFVINGKNFLLAHGDAMGKGDWGSKCLKLFLNCNITRWLFGLIPQKTGFALANFVSRKSRAMTPEHKERFLGKEKEVLVQFCYSYLAKHNTDFFIFGHRHLPLEIPIYNAVYYNTGDWLSSCTFIRYEKNPELRHFTFNINKL